MNKRTIYIIIAIAVLLITLGIFWWLDMTKEIEKMTSYTLPGKTAYSIVQNNDEIQIIQHGMDGSYVKNIKRYKFGNDGKVKELVTEFHYQNKLHAFDFYNFVKQDLKNAKLTGNVISGVDEKNFIQEVKNMTRDDVKAYYNHLIQYGTEIKL